MQLNSMNSCTFIVDALNSNTNKWSRFGHILDDTRCMMLSLSRWKCIFVHREANEAAHKLSKEASISANVIDSIWRGQTPNCISDVVMRECLAPSL
jgi:hypothetical protein